jgi:hypothetical protein
VPRPDPARLSSGRSRALTREDRHPTRRVSPESPFPSDEICARPGDRTRGAGERDPYRPGRPAAAGRTRDSHAQTDREGTGRAASGTGDAKHELSGVYSFASSWPPDRLLSPGQGDCSKISTANRTLGTREQGDSVSPNAQGGAILCFFSSV